MAPKSKRARKAAAKKRKDAAAAAASTPVPMDVVSSGDGASASASSSASARDEALLASMPSAQAALGSALNGGVWNGAYDAAGKRLVAFSSAPGLARLSAEELRLSAHEARDACRRTLDVTLPPSLFAADTVRPRIATPAPTAARLAWLCGGAVLGVALEPQDAAMAAHTAPPMVGEPDDDESASASASASGATGGGGSTCYGAGMLVSAYRAPYGTTDEPVGGQGRIDLYAFHAYIPGDRRALRALHKQHERHLELLTGTNVEYTGTNVVEYATYEQAGEVYYGDDPDHVPRPIPIVAPTDDSAQEEETEEVVVRLPPDAAQLGDDDATQQLAGAELNHAAPRTSSASSDTKDGCGTPTGNSLWTSFNKLFSFGRSPDVSAVTEGVALPPLGDGLPDSLATSPTTPQSCAPGSTTCGSEEERSNGGGSANGSGSGGGGAASSRGSRRVLRAARTLKQPPSSPSGGGGGGGKDSDGTAAGGCGSKDVGKLADLLSATSMTETETDNRQVRRKKLTKVKRRPRSRLVPEDDDE